MRKLYYAIEHEFHDDDIELGSTGNKTISVYEIVNNDLRLLFTEEASLEDNSEEVIRNYINETWDEELLLNETFELKWI